MQGKTLKQWAEIYESKTGDKAELPNGFRMCYLAERGFCVYKADKENDMIFVYQVCGDAKFWRDYAELQACNVGVNHVCTICTRHIKPYIRTFGWEILKEFEKDVNCKRFLCQDSIGRQVIITTKDFRENGEPNYWATHYLNKKATLDDEEIQKLKGDAKVV